MASREAFVDSFVPYARIDKALTTNRHFEEAGFEALLVG